MQGVEYILCYKTYSVIEEGIVKCLAIRRLKEGDLFPQTIFSSNIFQQSLGIFINFSI